MFNCHWNGRPLGGIGTGLKTQEILSVWCNVFKCCVCPSNLEGLQHQLLVLCHDSVYICRDSLSARSYRRASKCSYGSCSPVRCNTDRALKQKSKEMQIRSLGEMRGHTNEMWIAPADKLQKLRSLVHLKTPRIPHCSLIQRQKIRQDLDRKKNKFFLKK